MSGTTGRPRRSTVLLAAFFLVTLAVYFLVRPVPALPDTVASTPAPRPTVSHRPTPRPTPTPTPPPTPPPTPTPT
ncbi:MAG: hypothetical protein ACTHQ3_18930, partial [Motilibacteraceae bacterium]